MDKKNISLHSEETQALLGTRYQKMSENTIDYWRVPSEKGITKEEVLRKFSEAEPTEESMLALYLHVPFCPQKCTFCAFSGANSLTFREGERYANLLAGHIKDLLRRTKAYGRPVRSVFIGGGSPDILKSNIAILLRAVRELPGVDEHTELGCEFASLTAGPEFFTQLVKYGVTRVSFGIQTFEPKIRKLMHLEGLERVDEVLKQVAGRVPVINADLITGLPGQTLQVAMQDLHTLMEVRRITAVTSYDFSPANAPVLLAGLEDNTLPPQISGQEQAIIRLQTYETFLRKGWKRVGTNTYVDPDRVGESDFFRISGNESIASRRYEDFLVAAGASAKSHLPGVRIEQANQLRTWSEAVERGDVPLHLPTCSTVEQKDLALWLFPLRHEGLPVRCFESMKQTDAISQEQVVTFQRHCNEGFITNHLKDKYELTLLGEIFMGHLVRELKSEHARSAFDAMTRQAHELGHAIAEGRIKGDNRSNDRQVAEQLLNS